MGNLSRRELLAGAIGGLGAAGAVGYSRQMYAARHELRLRPVTLVNGNTEPRDVYVRIYTDDGYEFQDTLTLEAAETDRVNTEGSTTTRTLHGPWEETPRRYALTVVHDTRGWPLTNEEIRERVAEDDPGSTIANVSISVNRSMFSVHVSAPGSSPVRG